VLKLIPATVMIVWKFLAICGIDDLSEKLEGIGFITQSLNPQIGTGMKAI